MEKWEEGAAHQKKIASLLQLIGIRNEALRDD